MKAALVVSGVVYTPYFLFVEGVLQCLGIRRREVGVMSRTHIRRDALKMDGGVNGDPFKQIVSASRRVIEAIGSDIEAEIDDRYIEYEHCAVFRQVLAETGDTVYGVVIWDDDGNQVLLECGLEVNAKALAAAIERYVLR